MMASMTYARYPFSLVHFVTEQCNARCQHCFIDFDVPSDPASELSLDEIRRLAGNLGPILYNVNITGGEPFLRQDLPDIVEAYATRSAARSIVITTNGWFADRIESLVRRYRKLDSKCTLTVSVSIDDIGVHHDRSRSVPGLYERAIASYQAVSRAVDRRIQPDIGLTVTNANAGRTTDILQELRRAGISSVFPILVRSEGAACPSGDNRRLAHGYYELVAAIAQQPPDGGRRRLRDALQRAKNGIAREIIHGACLEPRFLTTCRAGSLFGTICADGTVAPCELLSRKYPFGNLRDQDMDYGRLVRSGPAGVARKAIRAARCHCTFECAWTVNILTSPRFWPRLVSSTVRELL